MEGWLKNEARGVFELDAEPIPAAGIARLNVYFDDSKRPSHAAMRHGSEGPRL
jgi:hypothetical protein